MEIATALAKVLETRRLTITQFAAMGGVTEAMARRWIRGEGQPQADRFVYLVNLFPELRALFDPVPGAFAPPVQRRRVNKEKVAS